MSRSWWLRVVCGLVLGAGGGTLGAQTREFPIERDPRYRQACQQWTEGHHDESRKVFEQLCDEEPEEGIRPALIADFLVKHGAFEAALPFARRARQKVPEFPRSFGLLGLCLAQTGQHVRSVEVFRDAVKRHPKDAGMWFNLAIALGVTHQMLESMECLDRALELNPGNPQYHYNRGENWLARVRYEEAEREFRAAANAERAHPDSFWRLGQVLAFLERDEEAEQWFRRAVSLPDRPDLEGARMRAAYQYGVFLFERDRPAEAAAALTRFVTGNPEDRMGWMYLARAQKALGKRDEAAASLARYRSLQDREDAADLERRLREFRRHFEQQGLAGESGKGSGAGSTDEKSERSPGESG